MYEGPVQNLIDELGRLPGVGPKGAQRIAFHLLNQEPDTIDRLANAVAALRDGVTYCHICGNVSETDTCSICSDPKRDLDVICVVEESKDVQAIERTREFHGRYHVLGGALDPLKGIGPDQLNIRNLLTRIAQPVEDYKGDPTDIHISEVILATNPNTVGEATASYLARILKDFPNPTVSRLATGLSMGGDIEFADELTLGRALQGRRSIF